jgi:hypothetical protein
LTKETKEEKKLGAEPETNRAVAMKKVLFELRASSFELRASRERERERERESSRSATSCMTLIDAQHVLR